MKQFVRRVLKLPTLDQLKLEARSLSIPEPHKNNIESAQSIDALRHRVSEAAYDMDIKVPRYRLSIIVGGLLILGLLFCGVVRADNYFYLKFDYFQPISSGPRDLIHDAQCSGELGHRWQDFAYFGNGLYVSAHVGVRHRSICFKSDFITVTDANMQPREIGFDENSYGGGIEFRF